MQRTVCNRGYHDLACFVREECERRLRAYTAQERDINEHFETENEVLSGGYAYRQLYELIQNAADAVIVSGDSEGRIHVRLASDTLLVANSGAPLDKKGIVALLNARSSAKRGNQIGRFGIGFKSLLKFGGPIDIVSRTIGLRFDPDACRERIRKHLDLPSDARAPGMRLAEILDPQEPNSLLSEEAGYDWATTVVSAKIVNPSVVGHIAKEMEQFPPEFLLFLPADIELEVEVEGTKPRHISKCIEGDVSIVIDGSSKTRWRLFKNCVKIQSPEARDDATHIQARDDLPLAWAVPLGLGEREPAGRFWAFFPTQSHSRTSGILNAPWKLNSDRTNLIPGPWNEAIMEKASELIAMSLPTLATPEDYGAPVSAFPRQLDREDEVAAPLVKSLWHRILDAPVLPDTGGVLRKPGELGHHFIKNTEICRQWAELAEKAVRAVYIHPDCYRFKNRTSRMDALVKEARHYGNYSNLILPEVMADAWFEPLAGTDTERAKHVISFVGGLLDEKIRKIPDVPLIPAADGTLLVPSEAVITNSSQPLDGFVAVADEIACDPTCRKILLDKFKIKEFSDESWDELLKDSLGKAENHNVDQDWHNFWHNLSHAPRNATDAFFSRLDAKRLKWPTLAGTWEKRHSLVATDPGSGIPDEHVIDIKHIKKLGIDLPDKWLAEFPTDDEGCTDELEGPYQCWTYSAFDSMCKEHTGKIPQSYPRIQDYEHLRLPGGWRLLSLLPTKSASRLTKVMLGHVLNTDYNIRPVTLASGTRPDFYPKKSAPHPFWFHITEHGHICVGNLTVNIKSIQPELAGILADAGLAQFELIRKLFTVRGEETDLGPRLKWPEETLSDECSRKFWLSVFEIVKERDSDFVNLRELWQAAYSDNAIPSKVPTARGVLPLSKIYVTADTTLIHHLDDGCIVLLYPECAKGWVEKGAQDLPTEKTVDFRNKLSEPAYLLDLFPELAMSDALEENLAGIQAVWVHGLNEHVGPHKCETTVAMDTGRAIILDRPRFGGNISDGMEHLLRCLKRHRLLPSDQDFDSLLDRVLKQQTEDARRKVRAQSGLANRLLQAVGNKPDALLSILPPATREALTDKVEPSDVAELALVVHGPAVLNKLRNAMEAQGLAPPKRWGGQPARTFVLDLGFPLEFASAVGVQRKAELSISGPIALPKLHDYQEEILCDVKKLVSSGPGRRRAIISLPTGGGKTRVAAESVVRLVLCGDNRRLVLWVAQTDELCEQAVQCFRQLWVNVGKPGEDLRVVRLWGGGRSPSPPEGDKAVVVVASIQTLNSRHKQPELAWVAEAGIVVIDECHHAITPSYTKLMRWLGIQVGSERSREREVPVLGLSATPWRGYDDEESERLAARFDKRWLPADQAELHQELTTRGVLADRTYKPLQYDHPVELTPGEQQHVKIFGELPDSVMERIGEDTDRNDIIVEAVLQSSAESILLFANSVVHAQHLAARLHLAGCPAAAVSGQTDRLPRQHFTRKFQSGELRVLCNHSVLTTGFDAPKSDMILISRPVMSPVRYMQMVGRGLRGPKNGGTLHCEIVTVEDNIVNFEGRLAYQFCQRYFGD